MSLITKPPSWAYSTSNFTGTPSQNPGAIVTPGTSNADGSNVALLTAIAHDVEFLVLGFSGYNVSAADSSTLLDILIDPAGGSTWASAPLINDLLIGYITGQGGNVPPPLWYFFPIWIKSGASLGARARTTHTVAPSTPRVYAFTMGGNRNPGSWWCGQSVESIGINAATSKGTDHTPGNTGAFSSWTNFGSPISGNGGAVQWAVHGTGADTTMNSAAYHFQFGIGGAQIGPTLYRATHTSEVGWLMPTGPLFYEFPNAAQLQVRATCGATAEIIDVAAYVCH